MNRAFTYVSLTMILAVTTILIGGTANAATKQQRPLHTTINVHMQTDIGDVILEPGTYDLKIKPAVDNSSDPTVEFSRLTYGVNSSEGVSPEEDVVLTVRASAQDLGAPANKSGLIRASANNMADGLEIRGHSTEYVFQSATARSLASDHMAAGQ
jgi:hypothetical protein